jgi:hypothetical protein
MRRQGLLLGTVAVGGAVAVVSPAHADQYDFISVLDKSGMSYMSITDMIDIG